MHKLDNYGFLPEIWVVSPNEDKTQLDLLNKKYIVTDKNDEEAVKFIMYHILRKKFPEINWRNFFKIGTNDDLLEYHSTNYRGWSGENTPKEDINHLNRYLMTNTVVDIDKLYELKLLPQFFSNIIENTTFDPMAIKWKNSMNKKSGIMGTWNHSGQKPNLLVVDVSGSVPKSVAALMLKMVDTLRRICNADLIVTGGISLFFDNKEPLPSASKLRQMVPRNNETRDYWGIIINRINGKSYGNLICFGDTDNPGSDIKDEFDPWMIKNAEDKDLTTKEYHVSVDKIICYWTNHKDPMQGCATTKFRGVTGYARPFERMNPNCEIEIHPGEEWLMYIND